MASGIMAGAANAMTDAKSGHGAAKLFAPFFPVPGTIALPGPLAEATPARAHDPLPASNMRTAAVIGGDVRPDAEGR
jgi:hypothetical protein